MITMINDIQEAYENLSPAMKAYFDKHEWNYEQAYLYYSEHWAYQDRSDEQIVMMAIDHVLTMIYSLDNGTYGAY
jgi:ADP-glucose pyrophosphorylase